jgi:hypothetical protein
MSFPPPTFIQPARVRRELAPGSDMWPRPERKDGWRPATRPLAGGGESRRPQGVSNSTLKTENSKLGALDASVVKNYVFPVSCERSTGGMSSHAAASQLTPSRKARARSVLGHTERTRFQKAGV